MPAPKSDFRRHNGKYPPYVFIRITSEGFGLNSIRFNFAQKARKNVVQYPILTDVAQDAIL